MKQVKYGNISALNIKQVIHGNTSASVKHERSHLKTEEARKVQADG